MLNFLREFSIAAEKKEAGSPSPLSSEYAARRLVAGQKLPEYRQCFFCPAVAGRD